MSMDLKLSGMQKVQALVDPKKVAKATRNAVNATATDVKKESFKYAGRTFNIQVQRLKKDSSGAATTWIRRARANEDKAVIHYKRKRPGLQNFSTNKNLTKKRGTPVRVKITKRAPLRTVPRAFFLNRDGRKQATGVFQRKGKERYPIIRRTGPGISTMYESTEMLPHMEEFTKKSIVRNWDEKMQDQFK